MRSILEKALVHLLNEEHDEAESLFHRYMVERARQIHEALRQGEDDVLDGSLEDDMSSEEYFSEADLDDAVDADVMDGEDELGDDDFAVDAADDLEADLGDADLEGEADLDLEGEADLDLEGDSEVDERLGDLEDQLERLTAEFEEVMSKIDAEGDVDADADADADFEGEADEDLGDDVDAEFEDEGDFDAADDFVDGDEGDDDLADSMEDDMDDEVKEGFDEDDFDDITESVLADLEKVSVTMADGKEVADGKAIATNKTSPIPQKPAGARQGGKPVQVKSDTHKGFDRESAPEVKPMKKRQNTAVKAAEFTEPVKK